MSRLELPSGGWVEYREKLMAGDRFAVQDAVFLEQKSDGSSSKLALGIGNDLRNALLGRIITAWSFQGQAIPANSPFAADVVIGNAMDIDDYNTLSEAVQPLLDKISGVKEDPKKP